MARSRNIKPGFFTNEDLVELPYEFRLLFIGLWTVVDKSGRMEDRPKKIKMNVFPGDDIDVDAGLYALEKSGFIVRYEVENNNYIQVLNWDKHQNPHHKEKASTVPAPCNNGESPSLAPVLPSSDPADSGYLIPDSGLPMPDSNQASAEYSDSNAEPMPTPTEPEEIKTPTPARDKFQMFDDWIPEPELWAGNRRKAGCQDYTPELLQEFRMYWMGEFKEFAETQWQGKLIAQIKRQPPPKAPTFDDEQTPMDRLTDRGWAEGLYKEVDVN